MLDRLTPANAIEAIEDLRPVMEEMWEKYDLNILLVSSSFLLARGIVYDTTLTAEEKNTKINLLQESLANFYMAWHQELLDESYGVGPEEI